MDSQFSSSRRDRADDCEQRWERAKESGFSVQAARFLAGAAIGPAWAVKGDDIASPVCGPENGIDRCSIVLVDVNSGTSKAATTQQWSFVQQVAWSPQGTGMVVSAQEEQGGSSQILVCQLSGRKR